MKTYSVSEVVLDVRGNLETLYPDLWIEGEVSNLNCHSSGHCYFSLKDERAQISVAIFRDDFRRIPFRPKDGLRVLVRGRLTLYPMQGRFQMVGSEMEPQGKGGLQLAFEQLKARLEKEGLFDPARKRPIPFLPKTVGIITSLDGAALHDMLTVLDRRFANIRVVICPARMQGDGAASDIADALHAINRDIPDLEVILLGRGGGSAEDLWAFNEEVVARAIVRSGVPVIACIGHHTDVTIADFVADLRAPTPSAAAEMVIQAKADLQQTVTRVSTRLSQAMRSWLDNVQYRLQNALESPMLARPTAFIEDHLQALDTLAERLTDSVHEGLEFKQREWAHVAEKLHLLSPLATLSRGYSIAWKMPERQVLRSAAQVQSGDKIQIQLNEGTLHAEVAKTE